MVRSRAMVIMLTTKSTMWKMHMNTPSCGIFHWAAHRIFLCTTRQDLCYWPNDLWQNGREQRESREW